MKAEGKEGRAADSWLTVVAFIRCGAGKDKERKRRFTGRGPACEPLRSQLG
jgi:hypothetical protein